MNHRNDGRHFCLICGHECQPVLEGLYDDRFGSPGSYEVIRCRHCGLEQTWPRPAESDLKELYERFYNWGGEHNTIYTRLRERFLSSVLYRLWLKWDGDISFHLQRGTGGLLDIGCNEGRGLTIYSHNGFLAEGVEVNERAAATARNKGFTVYTTPLADLSTGSTYDVVVLSNVLEHAADPVDMLNQVRPLLTPEGQVWISCPNAASRWRRVFGRHWVHWHVPFHLWHFSPVTMKEILDRADFQIKEMGTFTPAQWLAASFCALFSRPERANGWMRSTPIMAGLMLFIRVLLLPLLGSLNGRLGEDCLTITAALKP